ncbi:hypothetical protein [Methylobacterium pseudosasicola]|uniref:Uncharacterized protein n=1 Tax=Methylobacterium pseudosasicola TaxID=582667 RepID=A0A1I4U053_9HYPH|nr:hypothetical protein [Methylobacterium pseudosasicola]SFM82231.1 hypothetical protein SAMN05192568_10616 [Methylobacterium pseudosasicola]
MSESYEKARAIAEAAANHWDQFGDTAGVAWLAEQIHRSMSPVAQPDDRGLCECRIGQCRFLTERCREIQP